MSERNNANKKGGSDVDRVINTLDALAGENILFTKSALLRFLDENFSDLENTTREELAARFGTEDNSENG